MDTMIRNSYSPICIVHSPEFIHKQSEFEFQEKISKSLTETFKSKQTKSEENTEYDPIGGEIIYEEKISKNSISGENLIIELFKKDNLMDFEEKLNLTKIVYGYFTNFGFFEEFFEEECHIAMVNWIYKYKKYLAENEIPSQIYDLLNNILNIFQILPIKVEELFSLNVYEKLNKIRKIIKNKNFMIYQKLDRILSYWSSFCLDKSFLNKKKKRIEYENEYEEGKEYEHWNSKKACFLENFRINNEQVERKIQNMRNSYADTSVYDSGILNTQNDEKKDKKKKKSVQWKKDGEINQINIFKYFDPPSAGAISQEEYESINSIINRNKRNELESI